MHHAGLMHVNRTITNNFHAPLWSGISEIIHATPAHLLLPTFWIGPNRIQGQLFAVKFTSYEADVRTRSVPNSRPKIRSDIQLGKCITDLTVVFEAPPQT